MALSAPPTVVLNLALPPSFFFPCSSAPPLFRISFEFVRMEGSASKKGSADFLFYCVSCLDQLVQRYQASPQNTAVAMHIHTILYVLPFLLISTHM